MAVLGHRADVRPVTADQADGLPQPYRFQQTCRRTISVTRATRRAVNRRAGGKSHRAAFATTSVDLREPRRMRAHFVLRSVMPNMDQGKDLAAPIVTT